MVTLEKMNVATKTTMADLERKVGRRRLYLVSAIVLAVLLLLLWRGVVMREKATPPPPPRVVLFSEVTQKDVPIYLDDEFIDRIHGADDFRRHSRTEAIR